MVSYKIYSKKQYDVEVDFIHSVIKNVEVKGKNLLDVVCGTGAHVKKFIDSGFRIIVDVNSKTLGSVHIFQFLVKIPILCAKVPYSPQ